MSNQDQSLDTPPGEVQSDSPAVSSAMSKPPSSADPPALPRPAIYVTSAFMLGIAAARLLPQSILEKVIPPFAVGLVLLQLVFLVLRQYRLLVPALPITLFLCLGALAGSAAAPQPSGHPVLEPFFHRPRTLFIAKVSFPPDYTQDRVRLPLFLHSAIVDGQDLPVGVTIVAVLNRARFRPGSLLPGDWILTRLSLKPFRSFANPGGFDYARYQAEQGLYARAFVSDERFLTKLSAPPPGGSTSVFDLLRSRLDRFRQQTLVWLERSLTPDTAAFYAAILVGYQRLISEKWFEHLARSGVTHLLSIGGLHLGLVSLFVFWTVRWLVRMLCPALLQRTSDQNIALWPALAVAAVYAGIAGFASPPVWRSMLMLTLCLIGAYCYRHPDSLSVLASSALVILVIDPNALWQISFQLTFVCMLALFAIYPKLDRFRLERLHPAFGAGRLAGRIVKPFEEAFWASLAVSLTVLPLTVYYFYGISIAGFVANILLVPFVGFLVLPVGLASVALFAVHEEVGLPFLKLGGCFMGAAQEMILRFSNLSWSYFWVGKPSIDFLIGCYALLAVLMGRWALRRKAVAAALVIILLGTLRIIEIGSAQGPGSQELRVNVIDVGQGVSTLVRFPTGESLLVDGGGFLDESLDMGRAVIAPFLWHLGVQRLDHVVLSHDHPDHRNGLRFVLSHFSVGCYWETGLTEGTDSSEHLAPIAQRRRIPIRRVPDSVETVSIGPSRIHLLHPSKEYLQKTWNGTDLNNVSLVLQVDFRDTHLVLPGDIDRSTETIIFRDHHVRGSVLLLAGHHGSRRSNGPFLLDRLRPQAMVFSCGFENPFGFPAPSVLEECRRRQIAIYRTDLDGMIEAVSDGLRWRVERTRARRSMEGF